MKTFKAGTIVELVNGRRVDVKEYIGNGLYQGHDVKTGRVVYFAREDVLKPERGRK